MPAKTDFADYCCELLGSVGPCQARRMFGGWGISTDGLTLALVADLGSGETLWLKTDAETRAGFEAAGCQQFTYLAKGAPRSLNFFSAPADALDSPGAMAPRARQALACALRAQAAKLTRPRTGGRSKKVA